MKYRDNLMAGVILCILIISFELMGGLPWWSFSIPVFLFGVLVKKKKWRISAIPVGFFAGFTVWVAATLFFHLYFGGTGLDKIAHIISISKVPLILLSGVIGGLITGVSFYCGKSILSHYSGPADAEVYFRPK
jgi:hypothetical protein